MDWLGKWFGTHERHEPLMSRQEDLPGIGVVRISYVVDCMGAMCPRPQLLTKKVIEQVAEGEVIEIVSDNPAAVEAFPWLAETLACSYLLTLREKDRWRLYLRKGLGG
jgi:TusA-related sulfurtransferase